MQISNIILNSLGTVNKNCIVFNTNEGNLTLYFSFHTLVAFRRPNGEIVCRENSWGNTTGKLLNSIQPDKSLRLLPQQFNETLLTLFQ